MQPQFGAAQCALHSGVSATVTCTRCGNFMCEECVTPDFESQCPTCRALAPEGFPFDATADFGTLWNHATSSFQEQAPMCILATVIFFALAIGGGMVGGVVGNVLNAILGFQRSLGNPMDNIGNLVASLMVSQTVSTLISMVVQGVALVGYYQLLIDVLRNKKADVARMFSQIHLLPKYVLMNVVIFFVVSLPALMSLGLGGLVGVSMVGFDWRHPRDFDFTRLTDPSFLLVMVMSLMAVLVIAVVALPLSFFAVPELLVSQCGPIEAIKRAWILGSGQRLRIFGYSFVAGLIFMVGVLACFVGIVAAMPIGTMLILALFLSLRQSSNFKEPGAQSISNSAFRAS